jgi:hypothetical protein
MAFKPTVKKCSIEDEGESADFYVRQPSGREMLQLAQQFKKDRSAEENAKDLFSRFVVNEDGSAITREEVAAMMEWRFTAMQKASAEVQEKIGLTGANEKKS